MEKIVCFTQIVQIIITPTPFALLWSVSEKVCPTKKHMDFCFRVFEGLVGTKTTSFPNKRNVDFNSPKNSRRTISVRNCRPNP